jgi:hypothetical protein
MNIFALRPAWEKVNNGLHDPFRFTDHELKVCLGFVSRAQKFDVADASFFFSPTSVGTICKLRPYNSNLMVVTKRQNTELTDVCRGVVLYELNTPLRPSVSACDFENFHSIVNHWLSELEKNPELLQNVRMASAPPLLKQQRYG